MPGPLHGVKIVDLSAIIAGPMATGLLADQGADVVKVEPLGIGDLCRWLGPNHKGLGAMFAAAQPARVERLVLNGFPLLTDAERAHFATFYFGPKQPEADGSHLLRAWENRLRSTPGWTDLELMHRYTVEGLVSGDTNWKAFPLIINADLSALLRAVQVPTMLMTNTGEDLYEATGRARAIRPDFDYAALDGGSHDIIDEQPQNWARTVIEYLGR